MSISNRAQQLIQRHVDLAATDAELAELEQLLAADAEVAHAFAEEARLHASLENYFRKQYKMDQVTALLNASEPAATPLSPDPAAGQPDGTSTPAPVSEKPAAAPKPLRSTFTPRYMGPYKSHSREPGGKFALVARNLKPIAVATLVLMIGVVVWTANTSGSGRLRLVSGRVTVAGREQSHLPENAVFEVAGREAAVIELPGGARIELAAATRAAIDRDRNQIVVKLETGGGDFQVQPKQPSLRVETRLGDAATTGGRFSLELITTLPENVSSTAPLSIQLPRLVVAVAEGTVTVKQAGASTTLSAGEERVFL